MKKETDKKEIWAVKSVINKQKEKTQTKNQTKKKMG
jgi:hypothetical protein